VWAAGHFFGFSEAADLALIGLDAIALGSEAFAAGQEVTGFVGMALQSKTESDLDEAGRHLARFICAY
jgi:hypothetical protein